MRKPEKLLKKEKQKQKTKQNKNLKTKISITSSRNIEYKIDLNCSINYSIKLLDHNDYMTPIIEACNLFISND